MRSVLLMVGLMLCACGDGHPDEVGMVTTALTSTPPPPPPPSTESDSRNIEFELIKFDMQKLTSTSESKTED